MANCLFSLSGHLLKDFSIVMLVQSYLTSGSAGSLELRQLFYGHLTVAQCVCDEFSDACDEWYGEEKYLVIQLQRASD